MYADYTEMNMEVFAKDTLASRGQPQALPATLATCLLEMSQSEMAAGCEEQEFILEPIETGFGMVQSIIQVLPRCRIFRHIYGTEPITAQVLLRLTRNEVVPVAS